MKKLLYITDREEYSEHNFIGPLFEKYLPKHMDVNIVYFSKYKSFFQNRNGKFVVPIHEKNDIMEYLYQNGIDVYEYDYVVVRNMYEILDVLLKSRDKYNIKVGYRLSFPKISAELERAKSENRSSLLKQMKNKIKVYTKEKLINRCDIFLPTSTRMKDIFYPNIKTKVKVISSAIDPENLHTKIKREDKKIVFAYDGTLSQLRNFERVLDAFSLVESDNWELMMSTKDVEYAKSCVETCKGIADKITITTASTKDELLAFISKCDVGLALLPNIDIFSTSTSSKVIDYYTSSIPAIMSDNELNRTVFANDESAWLCDFNIKSIAQTLNEIIKAPKDKIRKMGAKGQERLLQIRNYKIIAKDIFEALEEL